MSDDMGTDKHGRRRRAIRRLTQRTIPLPTSGSLPPPAASMSGANTPAGVTEPGARPAAVEESPLGASVASSLSELRVPDAGGTGDAVDDSAEKRARRDTQVDDPGSSAPPLAADELPEEEPTNPKLPFVDDTLDRQASLPPPLGSDRPKQAPRRLDTPPPQAAGDGVRAPALADSEGGGRTDGDDESIELTPDRTDEVPAEAEEATSRIPKLDVAIESVAPPEAPAAASGKDAAAEPKKAPADELPPTRLDSDVPTRPRIELSSEMALAAGRVTSLEVPPIRDDRPLKRGSKMPPSGEPRVISSLTGRRSSIPASSVEDDEAARPAVVVTRAKIISDRPPRPSDRPGRPSDRPAKPSDRPLRAEAERSDRAAKPEPASKPDAAAKPETPSKVDAGDRPSDLLERAARQEAERPPSASMRPSRRPGSADGDDFETLEIEDGVMETPALPLSRDSGPGLGADVVSSKAPPPPPQLKRAVVPPTQIAPAPPKAAPPPPPRAASAPLSAASVGPALAAVPTPTSNPAAAPTLPVAAVGASANANAASNAQAAAGAPAAAGAAGAAQKKPGQKQPRRRQWWETLFSDDYLRTVVRPTAAQIARQVDFMQASLAVSKGTSVLDVGCGLGQHALEFARRGCLVVALDLALPMITRAAEDAQQEGLRINFLHKDIRDIGFEGTFDAVICVGTTFGFFDDEQNREVLGRLANALKPGGRLLLEVVNRDHVLLSQPNLQWFEGDGCVVMEESDFNYYSSRLSVKRTMMREDGRQTESEYSIRLYALHELGQMMQQVGFRVKEVSGQHATRGVFFGAQSNRIILLAERKTQSPARGNGHSDVPPPSES